VILRRFGLLAASLLALLLASCAPNAADTPVPTLTLIPATATQIPSPVPPTLTPADLIAPEDLSRITPTTAAAQATGALHGTDLIAQDPAAAEMVALAQGLVQQELNIPTSRIRLVDVHAVVWTDSALNCPLPESEIVQQDIDGYRIVLAAAEQEYIFHTDVDRIVPCAAANERLLDGMLPTEEPAEATSEATPETTAEATEA
jgi:hypothetical protein